jgi:hypothetical protein
MNNYPLMTLGLIGSASFILILVLLHFLKPEFDPSWRMISEYEIGKYGWLMRLAFVMLSLSCFSLIFIFAQHVSIVGIILLLVNALALIGAAIYITDPITTPRDLMSQGSKLHTLFGALFIFGFPISATIITSTMDGTFLTLNQPYSLILVWIGFIGFLVSTIIYAGKKGDRGPDVKIGWPNRFMMLTYVIWIVTNLLLVK